MQLIDLATYSIELFAAVYFVTALATHLHYCWENPQAIELKRFDRKLAAPAVEPESSAAELLEAAEGVRAIESTLAEVDAVEAAPMTNVIVPFRRRLPDFAAMSIRELKALARDRKLPRYSNLTKAELVERLTAA